jgi:hypothetical protein
VPLYQPEFQHLIIAMTPLMRRFPPDPYSPEVLQRLYFDVNREYRYQQFGFLPSDMGADMSNAAGDDSLTVQAQSIQMRSPVDLTVERAREKAFSILKIVFTRLEIETMPQCVIKVVAHVRAPGETPDAKGFVAERLMKGYESNGPLGPGFFGGGVKFRSISDDASQEENLSIEPLVRDNRYVYVDYDIARTATHSPGWKIEDLSGWIDDAFSFVSQQAMELLEA